MAHEDVDGYEMDRLKPFLPMATATYQRRRRQTDVLLVVAVMAIAHALLRSHGDLEAASASTSIELLAGIVFVCLWFQRVFGLRTPLELARERASEQSANQEPAP